MSTTSITTDGDWFIPIILVDGSNEQIQTDVKTKLLEHKGNCFFDLNSGLNWDFYLSNKLNENDFDNLKAEILDVCYQVPNVSNVEITNAKYNRLGRSVIIQILINKDIVIDFTL
jgi:hypothetical protein